MDDVAIIGVGLHPFGRHGDKTAFEMGADAVDGGAARMPASRGTTSTARSAAAGRSPRPTRSSGWSGLTGIPFINVFNACATGAAITQQAANAIVAGNGDIVVAVGMDKHPRGAFKVDPTLTNVPAWYGENGQFTTTKFFGMKINRYCHDHGDLARDARSGGGEELPQRRAQPERLPSHGHQRGGDPRLADAQLPADGEDVLRPRRGRRGPRAVPGRHRPPLHRHAGVREGHRHPVPQLRRLRGLAPRGRRSRTTSPPPSTRRGPPTRRPASAPSDVDVIQLQDTDAGAEVIHMAENGFCADGEQEKLVADGATEITGPMPINTDGGLIANGEPIGASGLRQVHELVHQLRGTAGDRQVPGDPRVGYAQVYGAPGTAAVTILSR